MGNGATQAAAGGGECGSRVDPSGRGRRGEFVLMEQISALGDYTGTGRLRYF